eukprot:3712072-Pyramimonas_sp.AAC.1
MVFLGCLKDIGLLGWSSEASDNTWDSLGAVLRPLERVSATILTHRPLYWAILEAILRSLMPSWSQKLEKEAP